MNLPLGDEMGFNSGPSVNLINATGIRIKELPRPRLFQDAVGGVMGIV